MTDAMPLDHAVLLMPDLDAAVADWQAAGFTVRRGGRHANGSTHNALVVLADGCYLELIAFLRTDPQHRWHRWAGQQRWGLVDVALRVPSVPEAMGRAQVAGVAYRGPIDGGRTRTDGAELRWQIGMAPSLDLPFLCGDLTPRELRVPEGDDRVHRNGVTGVAALTMAVEDLSGSARAWQALIGGPPRVGPTALPGCGLHAAAFAVGAATVWLVAPGPDKVDPASARLRDRLAAFGPGPMGLALRAPDAGALPPALSPTASVERVGPA